MASRVAQRDPISSLSISAIGAKADTAVTVMLLIAFVEIGICIGYLPGALGQRPLSQRVARGDQRPFTSLAPSSIKKQQDHPFVLIPRMLPRASIKPFSQNRADLGLLFRCRRIDFSDPAQAVSFGRMRARDEGSADFGRVPAGFHTEAKRFFCHNVTRREILHHGAFGWAVPSWRERPG